MRNIFHGKIITGIELSTHYKGEVVGILGYGIDINEMNKLLDSNVISFMKKSLKEYELIKNTYKKIGVVFDENRINFKLEDELCRKSILNEIEKYLQNYKFFLNQDSMTTSSKFTRNEVYNQKNQTNYLIDLCKKNNLFVSGRSTFMTIEKSVIT